MEKYKNTLISIIDVLEIHKIACSSWKIKISKYLQRCTNSQEIPFVESEIDEMFNDASDDQKTILEKIFEPIKPKIDYDKITVGSVVKLKYTEEHIFGKNNVDFLKPFYVLAYNVPYCIINTKILKNAGHSSNTSFLQGGSIITYASNLNLDYITEVLEY